MINNKFWPNKAFISITIALTQCSIGKWQSTDNKKMGMKRSIDKTCIQEHMENELRCQDTHRGGRI